MVNLDNSLSNRNTETLSLGCYIYSIEYIQPKV